VAGAVVEIAAPLLTKRALDAAGVGNTAIIETVAGDRAGGVPDTAPAAAHAVIDRSRLCGCCRAEASVLVASRSLAQGRTTDVVAHRLGTAVRADRIAVVEHGKIAEIGSHDALLAAA
jgi:hypothetical protein